MRMVRRLTYIGLVLAMAGMLSDALGVIDTQGRPSRFPWQAMASSDLLDGYVAALNAHDSHAASGYYAEDAVVTQAVHEGNTFTGRDEVAGWLADNFAGLPDLVVTVTNVVEDDDRIAWEWIYTGTYTGQFPGAPDGQGQSVELRGISVMELEDGMVVQETLYYDNLAFLAQIGAMDAATPAAD